LRRLSNAISWLSSAGFSKVAEPFPENVENSEEGLGVGVEAEGNHFGDLLEGIGLVESRCGLHAPNMPAL